MEQEDLMNDADLVTAHLRQLRARQLKLLHGHKGLTPEERDVLVEQVCLAVCVVALMLMVPTTMPLTHG